MKMMLNVAVVTGMFGLTIFLLCSLVSLFSTFIKYRKLDELQRKSVIDSLAFGMIVILILHLFQFVRGLIIGGTYLPFISSNSGDGIVVLGNYPWQFESFFFDCTVISMTYLINRYRYGLITRKSLIRRVVFPWALIILLIFGPEVLYMLAR